MRSSIVPRWVSTLPYLQGEVLPVLRGGDGGRCSRCGWSCCIVVIVGVVVAVKLASVVFVVLVVVVDVMILCLVDGIGIC